MKIRLLKPYIVSAKGDILDPCDHIAKTLIGRGIAEKVVENKPKKVRTKKCQIRQD